MVVTQEQKKAGLAGLSPIGGLKRTHYWTPDGRDFYKVPAERNYVDKANNSEGVRDANLDKGWLTSPPDEVKLHCDGCDRWHDTDEEVEVCIKAKKLNIDRLAKRTIKKFADEDKAKDEEVAELRTELSEVKTLLEELIHGRLFQQVHDGPEGNTEGGERTQESTPRSGKAGVQ